MSSAPTDHALGDWDDRPCEEASTDSPSRSAHPQPGLQHPLEHREVTLRVVSRLQGLDHETSETLLVSEGDRHHRHPIRTEVTDDLCGEHGDTVSLSNRCRGFPSPRPWPDRLEGNELDVCRGSTERVLISAGNGRPGSLRQIGPLQAVELASVQQENPNDRVACPLAEETRLLRRLPVAWDPE